MNTMLAGFCDLCDDFGHSNFDKLCEPITEVSSKCTSRNASALIKDVRKYQRFLKTTFHKLEGKHSQCLELCLSHTFDSCSEQHDASIAESTLIYNVHG